MYKNKKLYLLTLVFWTENIRLFETCLCLYISLSGYVASAYNIIQPQQLRSCASCASAAAEFVVVRL